MKYRGLLLVLLLSVVSAGQTPQVDSLLRRIYRAGEKDKLDLVLQLCNRNDVNMDTFRRYSFIARSLAQNDGKEKQSLAELYVVWSYYLFGLRDSAKAVIASELKKNPVSKAESRELYYKFSNLKALCFMGERNYHAALQVLYPLVNEAQQYGDSTFVAQNMHTIAIVEGKRRHPRQSIEWELQALVYCTKSKPANENILATIYSTLGAAYTQLGNADSAAYYNDNAIKLYRKNADLYNLAIVLQEQADILMGKNRLQEAEAVLNELSELNKKTNSETNNLKTNLSFINFYISTRQYDKAIAICKDHLTPSTNANELVNSSSNLRLPYYEALARCYKAKGDLGLYTETLEQIIEAKDTFYHINSAEAIAELQTRYEVQKKEATIAQQRLSIIQKNYWLYGSILFLLLGMIIIWLVFREYRRKQKLRMEQLYEKEQRRAVEAVAAAEEKERRRIAADLHDNLGAYAASIASNVEYITQRKVADDELMLLLKNNSQSMVSQLNDTIWVLKKETLSLIEISDRVKLFVNRMSASYPQVKIDVIEDITQDTLLQPSHAFHLFQILQEGINNALRHSGASQIIVHISSGEQWTIRLEDNGRGMPQAVRMPTGGGNGLPNMLARAQSCGWHISWQANEPRGTAVVIAPTAN